MAKETSEIECALPEVATANGEQQFNSTLRNLILSVKDQGVSREQCAGTIEEILGEKRDKFMPREQFEQLADEAYGLERPCSEEKVIPLPAAKPAARFELHDMAGIQAADIPRRQWVLGNRVVRRYASMLVAPGGVGKSMLAMTDAVAVATGKNLLGDEVFDQGPVWIYNAEDPAEEIAMRLAAICQHYDIDMTSLPGKVIYSSGRTFPLELVRYGTDGRFAEINEEVCQAIIDTILDHGIKLIVLDPLVRIHNVSENDNKQMDVLTRALNRIADEGDCGVLLIHHTRKMKSAEGGGDMDTSRGASAVVSAARIVDTLSPMPRSTARDVGISEDERWRYVKLSVAKRNMAAYENNNRWFRKTGEKLANGENIGVLEPANLVFETPVDELAEFITDHLVKELGRAELDTPLSDAIRSVCAALEASERKEWSGYSDQTIRRRIEGLLTPVGLQRDGVTIALEEKDVAGKNSKIWIVVTPVDQE
jgi:hypothetical protein